jgi:hypothetical protein
MVLLEKRTDQYGEGRVRTEFNKGKKKGIMVK